MIIASANRSFAVYPRTYGEHMVQAKVNIHDTGLSPYLRGTLNAFLHEFGMMRFIPVLTGNTHKYDDNPLEKTVYPRTYGEHPFIQCMQKMDGGLSPYLRGTLLGQLEDLDKSRFIPVLTGNTVSIDAFMCAMLVYPRTYGEHAYNSKEEISPLGLSPYLRGTPVSTHLVQLRTRFIPVLTGNTATR
ncbi:hypothetical protein XNW1_4470012 [Xenorhabdus nematophila str. Websteri]|nr:hypothetical protein XNW1_1310012 [Xenorhabdus nematophila str. Websteri]CEF32727.1 hypothetical protein XNW1_4470012 [Xenorhabdus nematophila str. Websteri]